MVPIIAVVGKSNSGKTRLLEKLVPELGRRGHRVAVVKHMGQDFELDRPNKDSWRLTQSGSETVILSSAQRLALIKLTDHDASLAELAHFVGADFDLILTEGYRHDKASKIEVHRKELGKDLLCSPEELLALVSDEKMDVSIPQFTTDDVKGLADLIERNFLGKREDDIAVFVNDKPVPLNPFVKEFLIKTMLGMMSALRGVEEVKKLDIWFRARTKGK
mgnify:CR=1 FL=1